MEELGSGPFTFLFTDIVGSTGLWEREPVGMSAAVRASEELQRGRIVAHRGEVFKNTGDGLAAVFADAAGALSAAAAIQLGRRSRPWTEGGLEVRIGIHTGEAEVRHGDYFGAAVNLAARVMTTARPCQVLLTAATAAAAADDLAPELALRDLGSAWMRGFVGAHHLFQLDHPELGSEFAPVALGVGPGAALPARLSTFVDRQTELTELVATLRASRLVTLVGPAGVGKSRLAQEAVRRVADDWDDGLVWCPLGLVPPGSDVLHALAAALGVSSQHRDLTEDIVTHLVHRQVIVLLDGCEHVATAVRDLAIEIVRRCPATLVVATSQEPLHAPGEVLHVVEPLPVAAGDDAVSPAVELFIDRATAAGARLRRAPGRRGPLERLCARLDGLPLAIELAAPRCRMMSVAELHEALDQRFALLASPSRDGAASARHQTLRAAVQWSYDLLDDEERLLFELLGVFTNGCDLDAASAIAAAVDADIDDVREVLWRLVDKSLVRTDTSGAATRYTMLSTLWDFAVERLVLRGIAGAARDAHAAYFLEFAERAERERGGPDERLWVEAQLRDFENLRSATRHADATGDVDTALRLYVALYEVAALQGRVEVFDWLDPHALVPSGHELVPAAMAMAGLRHDPFAPVSLEDTEAAIELYRRQGGRPHRILTFAAGFAAASRRDREAALRAYEETVVIIESTEGRNGRWINARALAALTDRRLDEAGRLLADARRVGQPSGIAFALLLLARSMADTEPVRALEFVKEARAMAISVANDHGLVYVNLAGAQIVSRSAPPVALAFLVDALQSAVQLRQHEAMWRSVGEIVTVLRRAGRTTEADDVLAPWLAHYPDVDTEARLHPALVAVEPRVDARPPTFDELVARTREIVEVEPLGA